MRCSVVFGITLRLLVINIWSSSPAITTVHRRLLRVMSHTHTYATVATGHGPLATVLTTPACCSVKSRQ